MAIDVSKLLGKRDNEPGQDGKLSASEWNTLVQAVQENQDAVKGAVKGIRYNKNTLYKTIDKDGILEMIVADTSGRNVEITALTYPDMSVGSHYITPADPCIVEFVVKDYEVKNGEEVPFNRAGEIKYYINKELVHTQSNVFAFGSQNYTGPISFDFSKYGKLTTSTTGNELEIEYSNNGVIKSEVYYVWMLDVKLTLSGVDTIYTTNNLQNIKYTFSGYQNYLMYVKIDDKFVFEGKECDTAVDEYITGDNEIVKNCNTHGVHILRAWAEVPIPNSTFRLATPVQEFTYIFGDINNNTPVVMSNLLSNSEYELYNKLAISYFVYLSNATTTKRLNISLFSTDDNKNKLIEETNQDIQFVADKYVGSHTFSLFPNKNATVDDIIGNAKISLSIDNNDPFEVPVIIKPSSIPLTQERNYYAYFTAQGRNNFESEETLRRWTSEHSKYPQTPIITDVTFSDSVDFKENGSGWNVDNEGNTAMHLRRGNYFTVNYKPFTVNPVYTNDNEGKGVGLTISIEFATRNCLNANAKVIECMDDGVGFYVTAGEAFLKSATTNLKTSFKEDTRIKLDIVIEDELRKYKYYSAVGKSGVLKEYESDQSYAIMFVDGVYSGVSLIQKNTTFKQENPQFIKFGSEDCDLDVYSIRIYDKTLNIKNIVDNYAYDTPNISEKLEIAKRNLGILGENVDYPFMPNINIERTRLSNGIDGGLKVARPDLPIFYVTLEKNSSDILPNTKDGDGINSFTQFVNPLHNSPLSNTEAMSSFEVSQSGLKNQGTSSMNYPWPWRNFDWKLLGDKTFHLPTIGSSVTASKWYQFPYKLPNSNIAIKKITLKKDYASSEMCNNAITSEYFTDMALGIYDKYIDESANSTTKHTYNPGVLSPAMYDEIKSANKHTDLRLALKSLPCFCVQKLNPGYTDEKIISNTSDNNFAVGMMNLIPNKNEVGYLGFKKNKWEDSGDGVTAREQSWELSENYEHIYWVKPFEYLHKGDNGNYVSDLDGYYEARTPKDSFAVSGDFGILDDNSLTAEQLDKLYDEQKDIIDFHNWACSVDRGNATDKPLTEINGPFWTPEPWNVNPDTGAPYETDSADYRFAKFKAEAEKYLLIDQWILYYIWREQFWMYDSGFKNLQIYTIGPNPKYAESGIMQWGCMVRDADTALGIQNVGEIVFPPHLEDIDYGTQEGDDENGAWTFHYNGAENVYSVNQLKKINPNGKSVLNGQFGSLWLNIRDAYSKEIRNMYNELAMSKSLKFNAADVTKKFRDHQENWSESLYNFGLRQYIGGELFTSNLKAACGDKKHSRAQWLERAFFYRASKYKALGDDKFSMRAATYETTPEEEKLRGDSIRVKTYIPMYIGMGGSGSGNEDVKTHLRIVDQDENGNYYRDIKIGAVQDGFNYSSSADTNNYIFGISMITDFDDLARYIKLTNIQDLKDAPKLRKLQFGHESERDGVTYHEMVTENGVKVKKELSNIEANQMLSLNACPQLELLDLTNHKNLPGISIDKCLQLKELYLRGTDNLTTLVLPKTTLLETLYLGDKLTALDLSDLSGIKKLVIDGLDNCTQLTIRNSGDYVSKKDVSYKLMTKVINNTKLNRLILEDIVWDLKNESNAADNLRKILDLRAKYGKDLISLKGKITNLENLTGELKLLLTDTVNGFGNIDDPNNDLYIQYEPIEITSAKIASSIYLHEENTKKKLTFVVNPEEANTYASAYWEITDNDYAEFANETDAINGIITRHAGIGDHTEYATLTVTIKQLPRKDGRPREDIVLTSKVYFYERLPKPGDYVFPDGSYSDEIIDPKIGPIGICFYVDPVEPKKFQNRLMMALNNVTLMQNQSGIEWGLGTGDTYDSGTHWGSAQEVLVKGNPNYDCYDVSKISNLNGLGPEKINGRIYYEDQYYRDANNTRNDYFTKYNDDEAFGNIGYITVGKGKDIYIDEVVKPNGEIGSITVDEGERVPVGYYNTMAIIEHRNKILDSYYSSEDGIFRRPTETRYGDYVEKTELSDLKTLCEETIKVPHAERDNAGGTINTNGHHLYFPAASACFAYEPSASGLLDEFKVHNWFLPSAGELVRMCYYTYQSYADGKAQENPVNSSYGKSYANPANAFYKAILEKKLSVNGFYNSSLMSSSEGSRTNAYWVSSGSGLADPNSKASGYNVRPICRF